MPRTRRDPANDTHRSDRAATPTTAEPTTGAVPIPEQEAPSAGTLRSLLRADPTLRVLAAVTALSTVGRGAFFALTALYLNQIVGLTPLTVGAALSVAGGVGVVSSFLGGALADRLSARRLLISVSVAQGLSLAAYLLITDIVSLILVASLATACQQAAGSVRSAIIGRGFSGPMRVSVRATLRTITNAGIAVGTGLAAVPLALGTAASYRVALFLAGIVYLAAAFLLVRLDSRRVDAPHSRRVRAGDGGGDGNDGARERGSSPLQDPRFLAVTVLCGVVSLHFGIFEVGVPLWLVAHTRAPDVLVAAQLVINTVVVIALQIPLSRRADSVAASGRIMLLSGIGFAVTFGLWAAAGSLDVVGVTILLVGTAVWYSLTEVMSAAAGWTLSFELADQRSIGAYQGVFGTGTALGIMVAPLLVTGTAVELGAVGWGILAIVFTAAGAGLFALTRSAAVPRRQG
ncbi:MFS transporter [Mycetocola reblochoni]|uniref:MFS transporter n=2 Tax=Mycetocola reblochoni TaxID=331618 RepID=A0A3L6ZNR9_9MICO|nr:MFS transporter [Mycetocola reblochoni]RLP69559.1 MFS transporter [Mycetocola reblochoni]SJN27178.1 putative membrane transport protein [Mycetocola reblochoni REB411]